MAIAHQQQVAAVIGFVHDVARNEHCCSAPGKLIELVP
jgi:hypothetical protein